MPETLSFCVPAEADGERLDKWLSGQESLAMTRSALQVRMEHGDVTVNGKKVPKNYRQKAGDQVLVQLPEPEPLELQPENIPLDIVYEDDDLLVVNKPKGMVVHPAPGHATGTLVHALLYHCGDRLSSINGIIRPGIVHRIDRFTSGLLMVAKNDMAHQSLADQLKEHSITRKYRALVHGNLKEDEGTVEGPIGRHATDRKRMAINYKNGKPAVTHYKVLERFGRFTWIECRLETGRTHQIRVHMASIGHPLLGDALYGPAKCPYQLQGQTLHAYVLGFIHPSTGQYLEFESPLPEYFEKVLRKLKS